MSELDRPQPLPRIWLYLRLGFSIVVGFILWNATTATDGEFHVAVGVWLAGAGCGFLFSMVPVQYRLVRSGLRWLSWLCSLMFVAIIVLQLTESSLVEQWLR